MKIENTIGDINDQPSVQAYVVCKSRPPISGLQDLGIIFRRRFWV